MLVGPAVHIVPIRERATIKSKGLKVNLVTVVLCWVYVIIQRKIMSSIFCPKQAVLAIEIFERRTFSKRLCGDDFT